MAQDGRLEQLRGKANLQLGEEQVRVSALGPNPRDLDREPLQKHAWKGYPLQAAIIQGHLEEAVARWPVAQ